MTDDKKVIKEFIEMIEGDYSDSKIHAAQATKDMDSIFCHHRVRKDIIESHEYEALKALADKPVIRENRVTDEMVYDALYIYRKALEKDHYYFGAMKEALEAVMEETWAKQCPDCKVNLYRDVCECPKEQAKSDKKIYRLSDMWKGWLKAFTGYCQTACFYDSSDIKKYYPFEQLIAITPADQDHFFVGEGLEDNQ